jgi:hypothetical protein
MNWIGCLTIHLELKKIKTPEDKKLKTYEHVKYVYELMGKK